MWKPLAVWIAWLYLSRKFILRCLRENPCKALARHGRASCNCLGRVVCMRSRTIVVLLSLLIFGGAGPSSAQYFGRNKVQYERFDFQVLATDHFDIYYYPEEEAAIQIAARLAERWHARLTKLLAHELRGRQPLIMYAAHPHFQQTNILGDIGEGTGGVTESNRRRVILPFAGGLAETDHVLGHELVHAFQYDIAAQSG